MRKLGLVTAGVTFAVYMIGAGRAFEYDAAVTMYYFVDRPVSWAFTRQVWFNNHPLFSLIENLVGDVFGVGEVAMRVAPALIAGAAVGLVVWRLGERWGRAAGVSAGLVMAAHPMLAPLAREVRGYGLATLAVVVMGVAVLDVRRPWMFGVGAFVGLGTHLYVLVPMAAMLSVLVMRRELTRSWRVATISAVAGGLAVYVQIVHHMKAPRGTFDPTYPVDVARAALGETWPTVLALALVLVLAARHAPARVLVPLGLLGCGVLGPWLLAPTNLSVRFNYWIVPALALAVGYTVHRHPHAVALVGVGVVAAAVSLAGDWTADTMPNRELAKHSAGACTVQYTVESLFIYREHVYGWDCPAVALLSPASTPVETTRARERWPVVCWTTDGAEVRARRPADC